MMTKTKPLRDIEEFEKVFRSMWSTAGSIYITKEDVEKEIESSRASNKILVG